MMVVAGGGRRDWLMPHGRSLAAPDGVTPARHPAAARKTVYCRPTRRALAPTSGPTGPRRPVLPSCCSSLSVSAGSTALSHKQHIGNPFQGCLRPFRIGG